MQSRDQTHPSPAKGRRAQRTGWAFLLVPTLMAAGMSCDLLPGASLPCRDTQDCAGDDACVDSVCTNVRNDGGAERDGGGAPDVEPDVEPDIEPDGDAGVDDAGNVDSGPDDADAGRDDAGNNEPEPEPTPTPDVDAGDGGNPSPEPSDGGVDAGAPDPSPDPIDPQTFSLDALDGLTPDNVTLLDTPCEGGALVFDTDLGMWSVFDDSPSPPCENYLLGLNNTTEVVMPPTTNITIAVATTWNFSAETFILVVGARAAVFYATGTMTLNGTINANGEAFSDTDAYDGAGGIRNNSSGITCVGGDGAFSGKEGGGGGGGGGSTSGGTGGVGKSGSAGGVAGTVAPSFVGGISPGCRGGKGGADNGDAGEGGGAGGMLQFVSDTSISGSGYILVNGGPGGIRLKEKDAGGGGGSGGSVWLLSRLLEFDGVILANGGPGGGAGGEQDPEFGTQGSNPALGRCSVGGASGDNFTDSEIGEHEGGAGGAGGWRMPPTDGQSIGAGNNSGGGGGGAAGAVVLTTVGACPTVLPRTSPEATVGGIAAGVQVQCSSSEDVCGDGDETGPDEECDDGVNLGHELGCGCGGDCTDTTSPSCDTGEDFEFDVEVSSFDLANITAPNERVHFDITGSASLTGVAADMTSLVADCRSGTTCDVACNNVIESCQVICRRGATCDLDCNDVGGWCALFCDDGANCTMSQCNNVGPELPQRCSIQLFTALQ